jgi:hypothetical protein
MKVVEEIPWKGYNLEEMSTDERTKGKGIQEDTGRTPAEKALVSYTCPHPSHGGKPMQLSGDTQRLRWRCSENHRYRLKKGAAKFLLEDRRTGELFKAEKFERTKLQDYKEQEFDPSDLE